MPHHKFDACIDACNACVADCNYCAASCLREPDVKMMARCIALHRAGYGLRCHLRVGGRGNVPR